MSTAGFNAGALVKRRLQAALYFARKHRRERQAAQPPAPPTPPPTGP